MSIWICPDQRCHAVTITDDDTVSITCTRREPHLPDRVFPQKVRVDVAALFEVSRLAAQAVKMSGNRSCQDGDPPIPHVNPRAFAALASAVATAASNQVESDAT